MRELIVGLYAGVLLFMIILFWEAMLSLTILVGIFYVIGKIILSI